MLTHNCTSVLSTDCYVAVTGLPNPQPDHAVIMCKFAQECMNAMVELFPGLVDALGADTATLRMVRDSAEPCIFGNGPWTSNRLFVFYSGSACILDLSRAVSCVVIEAVFSCLVTP